MPANEQQWRSPKLLHLVFGLTCLAMLGTTIWMLAADHLREWKNYQRKFRDVEAWVTQARIDEQETSQFSDQTARAERSGMARARAIVPSHALVVQFEKVAETPLEEKHHRRPAPAPPLTATTSTPCATPRPTCDALPS